MGTTLKLTRDEEGKSVDPTLYRSMIVSHVNLTIIVLILARVLEFIQDTKENPKESHINAVKKDYSL